jgi:outer membrane receptor for ferrienterochelin and colicins
LDELYYYTFKTKTITAGSTELKPEKSHYGSLNVEYVHNRFTASVNAYVNSIEDMISSKTTALSSMPADQQAAILEKATAVFGATEIKNLKNYKEYKNFDKAW